MEGQEKTQEGKNVTGSRASVQPERPSSLVDRNMADNVFFKPIKQPEDENILGSFF